MSKVTKNFELYLKATESAAIAAAQLRGNGDGKAADKVATEAMRKVLQDSEVHTRVVIGEGERDDAPMLYIGEEMGNPESDLKIDIAVDPLECTNHCAKDLPDALSVLAAAPRGALLNAPDTYMNKLCGSSKLMGHIALDNSVEENLSQAAKALQKNISELKEFLTDKCVLFVGNSGAGKSTLTSKIIGKNLKISSLSNDQGVHTTSISSLYEIDSNIKIIDSPGMRDIAIENYSEREIINGFEEIHNASKYCKFNNCNHIDNEGCNITKKLLNDEINESRYNNFIKFLNIK